MATTFAVLGNILFQALTSPASLESRRKYDYAEHKTVESRPKLQFTGTALEEITLEIAMHAMIGGDPRIRLKALHAAAAAHQAMPLVFGNGDHRGYFVIAELTESSRKRMPDGSIVMISVSLHLREWVKGIELNPHAPPKPAAPPPAVAVMAPATDRFSRGNLQTVVQANGTIAVIDTSTGQVISQTPPAPGTTALLANPNAPGLPPPGAIPAGVPPSTIVRAGM